jgi:hypothetical protein
LFHVSRFGAMPDLRFALVDDSPSRDLEEPAVLPVLGREAPAGLSVSSPSPLSREDITLGVPRLSSGAGKPLPSPAVAGRPDEAMVKLRASNVGGSCSRASL